MQPRCRDHPLIFQQKSFCVDDFEQRLFAQVMRVLYENPEHSFESLTARCVYERWHLPAGALPGAFRACISRASRPASFGSNHSSICADIRVVCSMFRLVVFMPGTGVSPTVV